MSLLLVRKAFELLEDDIKSNEMKPSKKKSVVKLITKHGSKKQHKKLGNLPQNRSETVVFSMKMKSPIDEYKAKHMVDRTEENLQILLKSSKLKPKTSAAQKVLEFHSRQQKKREIEPEIETPEPESILFPEDKKVKKKKRK